MTSGTTVTELAVDLELSLQATNKAPTTIRIYTTAVRQLGAYLAGHDLPTEVADVQRVHVEGYLSDLMAQGRSAATAKTRFGGLQVFFQRQDSFIAIPAGALPAHELGFALTIHKSQGSEYANVMVVLPPTGGKRLLTKELVYTAITRAKSLAIICSSKEVLKFAVSRKIVRESGVLRF